VKRSRGRGRRPQHSNGGGGGGGNNGGGGGGGHNPNRTFDSSGPEIKIRGSASNVYEKYLQLARDANSSGDRVMAENYLQHAEHYYRIMAAQQAQMQQYQQAQQQQPQFNGNNNNANGNTNNNNNNGQQPYVQPPGPSFSLTDQGGNDDDGDEADAAE
jgi:Domain of unknown function (DUF4167)